MNLLDENPTKRPFCESVLDDLDFS